MEIITFKDLLNKCEFMNHINLRKKKIIYIDMDNVIVDFNSAFKHYDEAYLNRFDNKGEIEGIFANMEPMKNAISSVEFLANYFDIYIISKAPWENPSAWSDKLNWVKKYLPKVGYEKLILTHNMQLNIGDYLIVEGYLNDVYGFFGEKMLFGKEKKFIDWIQVVRYICEKENISFINYEYEKRDKIMFYIGGMHGTILSNTYFNIHYEFNTIPLEYLDYDRTDPTSARKTIDSIISDALKYHNEVILIGNSLGGYWANFFSERYNLACILINPALNPKVSLQKYNLDKLTLKKFKNSTFSNKNKVALLGKNDVIVDNNFNAEKLKGIEKIVWTDDEHRLKEYSTLITLIKDKIISI